MENKFINRKWYPFDFRVIYGCRYVGGIWVRLWCKHGLSIKNIKINPLLFSERNGYHKLSFTIGKYYFKYLKP